jgi:hypothetical protein
VLSVCCSRCELLEPSASDALHNQWQKGTSCLTLRWEGGPGSRRLLLHQTHTHLLRHAKIALNSTDNVTFRRRKNTIVASFAPAVLPTLPRSSSLRKTSFCLLHRFRLASLSPNYVMRRAGSADSGGTTRTRYKISRIWSVTQRNYVRCELHSLTQNLTSSKHPHRVPTQGFFPLDQLLCLPQISIIFPV